MHVKPIEYIVRSTNPAAHLFEIVCTIPSPEVRGQLVSMAAWIPGSYMIRDFAKNVVRIKASDLAGHVAIEKVDKQTWHCAPCEGPLTLWYEVYAWDLSVRSAHLDITHGYFNGTSVFMRVHGHEQCPCLVHLEPPSGQHFADWRVATTMSRQEAPPFGFGSYRAANHEELLDHPIEMGTFTLASFEARGVTHDLVITGRQRAELSRLCRDLQRICEHHIDFFGGSPPVSRYLFLVMVVGEGYGGLEHRASSSLLCSRNDLPQRGQQEVSERYSNFLGLCSHEYFHLWNVKRIKPSNFMPYDLSGEVYTRLLWVFEGITSYYDDLALVRSGVVSSRRYLETLGQTITRVLRGPGRFKQSIAESSFEAWTKFYKQDENAVNAIVSYYSKGALLALALDLTLRSETQGLYSLDDVMQVLWERHGKAGVGVPENGMESLIEAVTGFDPRSFFDRFLYGTEELPLARLLPEFGVSFTLRPAESSQDKGGKTTLREVPVRACLGVRLDPADPGAKLAVVEEGSAAQEAGLAPGDTIMAIERIRVSASTLDSHLEAYSVGELISVHAFRRDELMEFQVLLKPQSYDTCVLSLLEEANTLCRERRHAWLHVE